MSTLEGAVKNATKAKYVEQFDEFVKKLEEGLADAQKVIELNEAVLDKIKDENGPIFDEAKKSFEIVIKHSKEREQNIRMKINSANTMKEHVEKNAKLSVLEFLIDFDKIAGQ